MAETPDISRAPRRAVPPTVVDVAPTVVDLSATSPVLSGRDIPFRGDGERDFVLHTARIVGAGGQGTVVEATDEQGSVYAAKLAWQPHSVRDRQARRRVLGFLRSLMTDHPLGANHYKRTHLMPLFAVGQATDCLPELGETTYDVAVMPLCEGSYADRALVSFRELRDTVIPHGAEALHLLHEQGIVHRDVKPKNLYRLHGAVVLGDFGISSVLDEGRDTSATRVDRRTPGYSPHSSVVQRENDWYAFGYTLWTLYNGGVHPHQALIDADDLSAVLAGGRPVPFVARKPQHEPLQPLIYGLTCAYAQGRLGYDDVRRWLDDPAAFIYVDPLAARSSAAGGGVPAGYRFEGTVYDRPSTLVTALSQDWERAKRHLYTGSLEEYFRRTGFHDVAVRLNDIVEGDEATSESEGNADLGLSLALRVMDPERSVFFWKGSAYPPGTAAMDSWVGAYLATPLGFYRLLGKEEVRRDLLGFLAAAGFSAQSDALAEEWCPGQQVSGELVNRVLLVLEATTADAVEAVRAFARAYGSGGWALWVQQHLEIYQARSSEGRRLLAAVRECTVPESGPLSQMLVDEAKLADAADMLAAHCAASPYAVAYGVFAQGESVEPTNGEGYFCASLFNRAVPQGFVGALMEASAADDEAVNWADAEVLGAEAPKVARQGAEALDGAADRLDRLANQLGSSGTIQGHGRLAFGTLFVAALAFTIAVVVLWPLFEQTAYEANTDVASSLIWSVEAAEAPDELPVSEEGGSGGAADDGFGSTSESVQEGAEAEVVPDAEEPAADGDAADSVGEELTAEDGSGTGTALDQAIGEPAPADSGEAPYQLLLQDFSETVRSVVGQGNLEHPEPFDVIGTFPNASQDSVVVDSPDLAVSPAGLAPNMQWPQAALNLSGIPLGVLLGWSLVGFLAAAAAVFAEKIRHLAAAIGMSTRKARLRSAAEALREEAKAVRAGTSKQRPWVQQLRTDAVPVRARTDKLVANETAFARSLGLIPAGDSDEDGDGRAGSNAHSSGARGAASGATSSASGSVPSAASTSAATSVPATRALRRGAGFARAESLLFWGGAIAMMALLALSTAAGFGIPLWEEFLAVFDFLPISATDFAYQVSYLVTTVAAFVIIALLKGRRRTMPTLAFLLLSSVAIILAANFLAYAIPVAIVLFILWAIFIR